MTLRLRVLVGVSILTLALAASAFAADMTASLKTGRPELKSASALAFGPDGVLFIGDAMGASIVAVDTGDRKSGNAAPLNVAGLNEKVAALLGTTPDQILFNDMVVNPVSHKAYLSVSRGRGPDAVPVILRVDNSGKIEEVSLDAVKFSRVALGNAPADGKDARGMSPRMQAITDIAYVDGRVFVAGLSNEEFSSKLRAIPFPFAEAGPGTSVEIYHGSHGRFETNSPVRTFVAYKIKEQQHILAAYTCTPLVAFPVKDLQPGAKVMGKTIAELGNRNSPLDMIVYQKDGKNYILLNNSSRGVMKITADGLDGYQPITAHTEVTGVPYTTIESLKGVQHLDKYDEQNALLLVRAESGSLDLKTVALP
jgi:hypothetical protein